MTETKELAKTGDSNLPAYLQGGKTTKLGNVDQNDLIIPRIKLLQSVSPEVEAYDTAKTGQFWHTLAEMPLGSQVNIIPIFMKKEIVLWAPRGDDRGILARSSDCVNWDENFANLKFEVKLKGIKDPVTYDTKNNVAESKLMEFGQINGDPDSRPAAALTYRFMFFCPDFADLGPAIIINTRSSVRAAKQLISKIELRPVDHYAQLYTMGTTDEVGDEGPYKGYSYSAAGYPSEEHYKKAKELYERFKDLDWKPSEEADDLAAAQTAGGTGGAAEPAGGKF